MAATVIIEDGSIVAEANSYISIADATTYFNNVGNTTWANLDPVDQQGQFLILAVRYMQQTFRTRWQGFRFSVNQVLDWPRYNVQQFDVAGGYGPFPRFYPPNGPGSIPQEIKDAQCELAVRVANGDLNADINRITTMEKVGSIQVTYAAGMPINPVFLAVELLLKPFFQSSGMQARIGRS